MYMNGIKSTAICVVKLLSMVVSISYVCVYNVYQIHSDNDIKEINIVKINRTCELVIYAWTSPTDKLKYTIKKLE